MKFDVIIGNPPCQQIDGGGTGSSAIPLYNKFVQQSIKLNPRYLSMITPSRWFTGGKGLDDFRDEMLGDDRLKEIHDHLDSSEVFDGVEIKGGVNFFLWDREYRGDCLVKTYKKGEVVSELKRPLREEGAKTFIRDNNTITIFHKVKAFNEKSFSELVSVQTPFGIVSSFKGYEKEPFDGAIKLYGCRFVGYVNKGALTRNEHWVNEYKVYVPKAIGSGDMRIDMVKPLLGEPNSCCTQTYLVIGPFENKQICENVRSYIRTKFFHFMLGLKKTTQNGVRGFYQFIPIQDFSKPCTDKELYEKYNLSKEEVEYIENNVRGAN